MKDYKKIDEILTRYWQCETSVEEEKALQDFFLHSTNIPQHLLKYQSLFEYRDAKQAEKLPDDFDEKILNQINAEPKRIKFQPQTPKGAYSDVKKSPLGDLGVVLKLVAGIALLVGLGFTAHLHQTRTEQAQARETVLSALFMISDNLQKGEEMIMRGLENFEIAIQ